MCTFYLIGRKRVGSGLGRVVRPVRSGRVACGARALVSGLLDLFSCHFCPLFPKLWLAIAAGCCNISQHAGVAELADAYGSGPYESNLMKVQVLSPAP